MTDEEIEIRRAAMVAHAAAGGWFSARERPGQAPAEWYKAAADSSTSERVVFNKRRDSSGQEAPQYRGGRERPLDLAASMLWEIEAVGDVPDSPRDRVARLETQNATLQTQLAALNQRVIALEGRS